ncbi:sulfotransferase [Halioglobus sp.]|nr:sulfotransferase [Halioglobus sp.]
MATVSSPNLFIIGMPRSGTKLLRTLLNNHPAIYIPDIETAFIPDLIEAFAGREMSEPDIYRAVGRIKGSIFFFYYLEKNDFDFARLLVKPPCSIYDILSEFYAGLLESSDCSYQYIGDKSPRNIYKTAIMAKGFPDAKFIHIVRDPRDYALSVRKAWGKNELRAVFRWIEGVSCFQKATMTGSMGFIEVRYEDLVSDTETTLKRCTEFLDLDYDPAMVQLKTPVENLGDARAPKIERDNLGKYRKKMSRSRIKTIDDYVLELLHRYGYPCSSDRTYNKPISAVLQAILRLLDVVSLVKFNIQQHGLRAGLEKITRASR